MTYYSQYQQDKILNEEIFKDKKDGYFIDVGATDGRLGSNSLFFEETLNWKGICIEPIQHLYDKLKENRKCITVNCACFNKNENVNFMQCIGHTEALSGIMTTYPTEHLKRIGDEIREHGGSLSHKLIQGRTLNDILVEHNAPIDIDYLSIDTEGSELQVLEGLDLNKYNIRVIDVENNYQHLFEPIRTYLMKYGYEWKRAIGGDEIYIKN